ncbi:5'-3' exonuclease [Sorangium sp. So ce388]|uniref:5'-3' exonuclease n=1 Tax=Sorangium sp. So ce388 TaxID=3133309 RepID=UPI003F5B5D60
MTALPAPGAPDVAYLLDLPGLVHRYHHAAHGDVTAAVRGTINCIRRHVSEQRPAYLAAAVECPRQDGSSPTWRHELYPAYKAARPPKPPELLEQAARVRAIVEAMAIPVLEAPGFEADDAIAAGCARAVAAGLRVVVIASDKDLQQLASDRVTLWNPFPSSNIPVVVGPDEVRARWKVGPELLGDILALAGDPVDGIPGVPGIGPAKAAALLRPHHRLARLLRSAGCVPGKAGENLRAHARAAVLSRQLVTLRADAPIRWSLPAMRLGGVDVTRLPALLERDGIDASRVRGGPKSPVPAEALERDAAWSGEEVVAALCAAEAELLAVVEDSPHRTANLGIIEVSAAAASPPPSSPRPAAEP